MRKTKTHEMDGQKGNCKTEKNEWERTIEEEKKKDQTLTPHTPGQGEQDIEQRKEKGRRDMYLQKRKERRRCPPNERKEDEKETPNLE